MTPEQKQQRDDALACPGLKQKDVDFLVALTGQEGSGIVIWPIVGLAVMCVMAVGWMW